MLLSSQRLDKEIAIVFKLTQSRDGPELVCKLSLHWSWEVIDYIDSRNLALLMFDLDFNILYFIIVVCIQ